MFEFEVVKKANQQSDAMNKKESNFTFDVVQKSSAAEKRKNAKVTESQRSNSFGIQDVNQDGKSDVRDVLRTKIAIKQTEDYNKALSADTSVLQSEISSLEKDYDTLKKLKYDRDQLYDRVLIDKAQGNNEQYNRNYNNLKILDAQIVKYGDLDELGTDISNKKIYLRKVEEIQKSAQKQKEMDLLYDKYSSNEDWGSVSFTSKAKAGGKRKNLEDFGKDLILEYINGDEKIQEEITTARYGRAVRNGEATGGEKALYDWSVKGYNTLTKKEKEIATYLYYKDRDAFWDFLESNENLFLKRHEQEEITRAAKTAEKYPVGSSLLSVGFNIAGTAEQIVNTAQYLSTGEMNKNLNSARATAIRSEVSDKVDWEIGNWDAFDFIYNTGMSAADSVVNMALFGKAGGVALGISAAAQATNDALDRGMSSNQAFWNGLFSGVFEGLFESVSIGNFNALKETVSKTAKDVAKNIGKTMLVNASEETLTEIANIAYDTIINGEFSQYSEKIYEYMNSGLSEAEAKKKVALEFGAQIAEAGASGALMGFGFGTAGSGISYFNNNRNYSKIGKVIAANGTENYIVDTGLKMPKDSESYALAKKIQSTGEISNVELGTLASKILLEANADSNLKIASAIGQQIDGVELSGGDKAKAINYFTAIINGQNPEQSQSDTVADIGIVEKISKELKSKEAEWVKELDAVLEVNRGIVRNIQSAIGMDTDKNINLQSNATETTAEVGVSQIDQQNSVVPSTNEDEETSDIRLYDDESGDIRFDDDFEFSTPETKDISRPPQGEELFEGMTGEIKTGAQRHILDMAKKLDSSLNVEFVEGLSTKGKFLRKSNRLLIRADLSTPQMYVELFKHEFMHRLETRKLYTAYMRYCFNKSIAFEQYARSSYFAAKGEVYEGDAEGVIKELTAIYYDAYKTDTNIPYSERKDFTYEDAQKEIIADFFGEVLFQGKAYRESIAVALEEGAILPQGDFETSIDALTELAQKKRTLFEKIVDTIKEWISVLKSEWRNRSVAQDLEYLEKRLEWVYQSADSKKTLRKAQGEVKNSVTITDSEQILLDMPEEQRYNVLKNKKLQLQKIRVDNDFDIDFEYLKNNIKSIVEKPLIEKIKELGFIRKYQTSVIDVDFDLTVSGVRKSLNSQASYYGGDFADFAKVILNLQNLLDNSVLLEVHSDKGKGTPLENPQLKQTYVLLSAFYEGNTIKPVQFEVKQYVDNNNRLYLSVALTKIETGVVGNTILEENQVSTTLIPISDISLTDLLAKINPKDYKLLKYVPNQFLNKEQLEAKNVALQEDAVKYGKPNFIDEYGQNSLGSPMQQLRYNPERYAKWLTRRFAAKIDVADIIPKLKRIVVESNKKTTELSENGEGDVGTAPTSQRLIRELAQEISKTVKPSLTPDAQERLSDIRHTAVRVDDIQRTEIEAEFGNITNFRRQTGLKISNDGISLDSRWQELSGAYPELFDADINPADMPTRIAEIIENLSENTEPIDYDAIAEAVAEQIQNTLDTTGPKAEQRKLEAARREGRLQEQERARRKVRHLVGNAQNVEGELAAEYKAVAQKAVEEERKRAEKSLNRESNRKAIQRNLQHLDHLLRSNTNARHIPEKLKPVIKQLCKMFLDNSATVYQAKELADIRAYYSDYIVSENMTDSIPSQDIAAMLEILEEELTGRSLANVGNEELEAIRVVTDYFNRIVNEENDAFVNGKKVEVEELGKQAVDAVNNKKTLKVLKALKTPAAESMREFFYEGNLTPYYLFKRLGGVFQKLFNDLVEGQSRAAKNMDIAHNEIDSIKKRRNYSKWKNDTFDFVTERGVKLHLTVEQLMQIYATAQRQRNNRIQKAKHLLGGIVLDQKAINEARKSQGKTENGMDALRAKAIKLTEIDLIKLSGLLSEEQIGYADDVVALMSNWCAALGNDVTMQLYGYRKYTERYYIPYVSASEFLEFNVLKGEQRLMKSPSFSKQLQKKANNPLLIQGFSEVAANHIDTMCGYNGTAVAIDTLNKVLNHNNLFEIDVTDGSAESAESVWALIESNYGKGMVNVLKNFIADVNNGVTADKKYTVFNKMLRTFRKTAVMANLSVAIQQPTAIVKATLLMNPKYLVRAKVKNKKAEWAECCLYAPIASLKQHGQFHGEGGTHNTEWILGDDLDNTGEKIKDLFSRDSKTRDDALGVLAEKGDQVTWRHLWAAVKLEIADTTNLVEGSEEFLTACGERFTDIIIQTQVYDSVLSRSQNMRDKGVIGSMTSFMMEPTIAINIAADSVITYMENPTSANGKKLARTVLVLSSTELAVAIFKSLITAMRDDDEDETYLEKYVESVVTNYLSGMNFASKIPLVSDVFSLLEGYTVERPDMQVIADFYSALNGLKSDKKTLEEKVVNLVGALGNLFGLPIKNVYRDISSLVRTITDFTDFEMPSAEKIKNSASTGAMEGMPLFKTVSEFVEYGLTSIEKSRYMQIVKDNTTYKSLTDSERQKVSAEVIEFEKDKESFEKSGLKSKKFEDLYEIRRKNGSSSVAYRNARKKLLESGISEDDIAIGLEIAKMKHIESNGITVAEYYTVKAALNQKNADGDKKANVDNSGGISKKEKQEAIDDMDGFTSKEKKILAEVF